MFLTSRIWLVSRVRKAAVIGTGTGSLLVNWCKGSWVAVAKKKKAENVWDAYVFCLNIVFYLLSLGIFLKEDWLPVWPEKHLLILTDSISSWHCRCIVLQCRCCMHLMHQCFAVSTSACHGRDLWKSNIVSGLCWSIQFTVSWRMGCVVNLFS